MHTWLRLRRARSGGTPIQIAPHVRRALPWLWLGVALLVVAAIRLQASHLPLERDEGEYAYVARLLLDGIPPYRDACNMKYPGTYLAYAAGMLVFGDSAEGVRHSLIVWNAATVVLLFLLVRRLHTPGAGTVAAITYALLSATPSSLGLMAHATHFVMFWVLLGLWLQHQAMTASGYAHPPQEPGTADGSPAVAEETARETAGHPEWGARHSHVLLFTAGICFGMAVLMKQHAAAFALFATAWLIMRCRRPERAEPRPWRHVCPRLLALAAGVPLPIGLCFLWLWHAGVFTEFWFWTFTYARSYVGQVPWHLAPWSFWHQWRVINQQGAALWLLTLVCIVAWLGTKPWRRPQWFWPAGFLLGAITAMCPGFFFREHYFILLMPAAAVLAGLGWSGLVQGCMPTLGRVLRHTPTGIVAPVAAGLMLLPFLCAWLITAHQSWAFVTGGTADAVCTALYKPNPFAEAVQVARYIRAHSGPTDRLAVFGSEPQLFYYAERRSASGFLYVYSLMEAQPHALEMQKQFMREVAAAEPRFVVLVSVPVSWHATPASERYLYGQLNEYLRVNGRIRGLVLYASPTQVEYHWGAAAAAVDPTGKWFMALFERVPAAQPSPPGHEPGLPP